MDLSQSGGTDSTGTGGGGSSCDTANMQYAANVVPILKASCTSCHGSAGGISLGTYAQVKAQVDNGALIGSITHASGYVAMPYNRSKLSDCEINTIKAWIARGALNN
ncbi:hypothetical protein FLA_6437 [Filimonas lacunae]|nr:hypothetical protein FLA_6437 [Filimonas lacunae]